MASKDYRLPEPERVQERLEELDKAGIRTKAFLISTTGNHFDTAWLRGGGGGVPKFARGTTKPRTLSADEVIALGMYSDGRLVGRNVRGTASLYPFSAKLVLEDWVTEIGPMLLSIQASIFVSDDSDDINETLCEFVTIGEALHTISRYPNAFERPHQSFTAANIGTTFARLVLVHGKDELREAAGNAWLSYATLATRAASSKDRIDAVVEAAHALCDTGASVEELQPYVNRFGLDTDMIARAWSNGISADMLDRLDGIQLD